MRLSLISVLLLANLWVGSQTTSEKMVLGSEAYLGMNPPGLVPEIFAPGFISTEAHEFSCSFSADGREFYFNRGKNIWHTYLTDTGWCKPSPARFNSDYLDNEPHITHDNQFLFFGSKRPHAGNAYSNEYGIWVVKRESDKWGEPYFVGAAAYISSARNGTIYTRNIKPNYRAGSIVKTRFKEGAFVPFIEQGGGVINPRMGFLQGVHPCIAPDESFLIFTAMFEKWGNKPELFVSFKQGEDVWGEAHRMSDLLGVKNAMTPYISPDGKYLFFYSNHDIYWVDINLIECFRPNPK